MNTFLDRAISLNPTDDELILTAILLDMAAEATELSGDYKTLVDACNDSAHDEWLYSRTCPQSEHQSCLDAITLFNEVSTWAKQHIITH